MCMVQIMMDMSNNSKMKKTILTSALILTCALMIAQDKSISGKEQQVTYCEIVGAAISNKPFLLITIDFGQSKEFSSDDRYKDPATGKPFEFTSMIDALNFMSRNGWEFVQAYSKESTRYFLLKKATKLIDKKSTN